MNDPTFTVKAGTVGHSRRLALTIRDCLVTVPVTIWSQRIAWGVYLQLVPVKGFRRDLLSAVARSQKVGPSPVGERSAFRSPRLRLSLRPMMEAME
jgi:hypothetical protein